MALSLSWFLFLNPRVSWCWDRCWALWASIGWRWGGAGGRWTA